MPRKLTEEICFSLIWSHRSKGWRAEKEVRFGSRRIDVLAISRGGSRVIGFEIKTDRQDFRNEIRNPDKTDSVRDYCTEFYFVTPRGLVSPSEIPNNCGLIYYAADINYSRSLSVARRSAGGKWWLTFEEACLMEHFHELTDWEQYAESQGTEQANTPKWMLPRYIRPLRFQFDVSAVAEKMAKASLPEFDLTVGMEAF